ncbi:hypothetical protein, partial [Listeria monocytogenes]|uniref:hypothetical protein n=1 Tax=Listeria monocytogenes TaxID=1639 RepID=UPI003F67A991
QPMHALALSLNRTNLIFRLSVIEACARIVLVLAGLYFYSLMGVIAARLVMSLIVFVMSMWSARHMIGTTLSSALMNLWQVAAASLAMATL